jgi:hypothetical protein
MKNKMEVKMKYMAKMRLLKNILIVLFFIGVVSGCKDDGTSPGGDPPQEITKSPKRGIAFDLVSEADFAAISKGISWYYNWSTSYNSKAPANFNKTYGIDFIPMLWGGNTSANDMAVVKSIILSRPEIKYLLVMNEPNLTDQANRTPAQAANDWLKYEQVINELKAQGREISLVGPAMTWGTMPNLSDPVKWLDIFISEYKSANGGREPKIDYLAFHWYDYGLSDQLDRLKKYNKKIWVTEMANWNQQINSYPKQIEQMKQMVAICESRDDVFRYAWFYGRGGSPDNHFTYLFTLRDGELSDLGKTYISLPFNKNYQ